VKISLTMLVAGTAKSLGPAQAKQMFLTSFLGAKPFLKLQKAKGFLLLRFAPFNLNILTNYIILPGAKAIIVKANILKEIKKGNLE